MALCEVTRLIAIHLPQLIATVLKIGRFAVFVIRVLLPAAKGFVGLGQTSCLQSYCISL